LSKFERYKKKEEIYIYPHKHCKKCGEMVSEAFTYCPECYKTLKEKKKRKFFKIKEKKLKKKKVKE
jgi:predicted nucleic acid-binding Zn ribbon protein